MRIHADQTKPKPISIIYNIVGGNLTWKSSLQRPIDDHVGKILIYLGRKVACSRTILFAYDSALERLATSSNLA